MRKLLWGGVTASFLISSLIFPTYAQAEAPTISELTEIASLAKKVGEKEHLFDVPSEIKPLLVASAVKYEVPEAILAGLIKKESEFRNIWGMDGSGRGLAQIDSYYHSEVSDNEAFEPLYSLAWASKYLKGLKEEFGSWYNALRAYNGGPNYASWFLGYGGLPVNLITAIYADTIYGFARDYAAKNNVEAIPEIPIADTIKSISAQLSQNLSLKDKSVPTDEVNKVIQEAKNKPCSQISCLLPTDFTGENLAQRESTPDLTL